MIRSEASAARNTAPAATSSGQPKRRTGILFHNLSHFPGTGLFAKLREDNGRRNSVHPDAVLSPLARENFRHTNYRGQARNVCDMAVQRDYTGLADAVDDPPALLVHHRPRNELRQENGRFEIHIHRYIPLLLREVLCLTEKHGARIVHEDVNLFKFFNTLFGRATELLFST